MKLSMAEKNINILFLGGAKRVSLAEQFIEKGKQRSTSVKIFSYELDKYVPIAAVGEVIEGLRWKDENLIDHLVSVVEKKDIHIILPFVDPAIAVASQLAKRLPALFIPVSEEEITKKMFDKVLANDWFKSNDFPVPEYRADYWPLIAKPRFGSASKGLVTIENAADFEEFKSRYSESDYLIQQFIIADEYTVDCYVDKLQNIISTVPRKRLEVYGGEATRSITVKDQQIIELSERILKAGSFKGPITIQFLKEKKGDGLFVMEINPRLGGGVLTSIAAGADVVQFLLNDFENKKNIGCNTWQENMLMVRAFREFYFYADNN